MRLVKQILKGRQKVPITELDIVNISSYTGEKLDGNTSVLTVPIFVLLNVTWTRDS